MVKVTFTFAKDLKDQQYETSFYHEEQILTNKQTAL